MRAYLDLLQTIKDKGVHKSAAREGMPGTTSLFGYQFRHDLSTGFPMITTKKISFKNIVNELLWFLRGDTNIKFLVDNGCNIWNEDAYNYYLKIALANEDKNDLYMPVCNKTNRRGLKLPNPEAYSLFTFKEFVKIVESMSLIELKEKFSIDNYILGGCDKQYGWLWRHWGGDQISELINGLRTSPESRRHIISAWNPETLDEMALNACHALVQFNCREMNKLQRVYEYEKVSGNMLSFMVEPTHEELDQMKLPRYKLDCQLYQRSADVFLGVPYNIASYSLLVHILCEMLNMIPGEFIHTFGDVHIYDNHMEQVDIQLSRTPKPLPQLDLSSWIKSSTKEKDFDLDKWLNSVGYEDFGLEGYDPDPAIKAKLSTGLK